MLKVDGSFNWRQLNSVRRILNFWNNIHRFKNPFQIGSCSNQRIVEVTNIDDRIPKVIDITDKSN